MEITLVPLESLIPEHTNTITYRTTITSCDTSYKTGAIFTLPDGLYFAVSDTELLKVSEQPVVATTMTQVLEWCALPIPVTELEFIDIKWK